jgi:hypothetical protein
VVRGVHTSTLTFSNIGAGDFDPVVFLGCTIDDGCISTFSDYFTFSPTGMVFLRIPEGVDIACGTPPPPQVTFAVQAVGASPLTYQWNRNGAPLIEGGRISGVHQPTLAISGPIDADAGVYTCTVSCDCATQTTPGVLLPQARLNIWPPTLVVVPQDQTTCPGYPIAFLADTVGGQPISYQWTKDGVDLSDDNYVSGSMGPFLFINPARPSDLGQYRVRMHNDCGDLLSPAANAVPPPNLTFAAQPMSVSTCPTGTSTLTVTPSPNLNNLSFLWTYELPESPGQWNRVVDGAFAPSSTTCASASGANTNSLSLAWTGAGDCPGPFRFRCDVAGYCNDITSDPAIVSFCRADFNCDGVRNVSDIFAFLAAFFAQIGQTGPGHTADFNNDGTVNVSDVFAFLAAWFAGC